MGNLSEAQMAIVTLMDRKFEVLKKALPANLNPERFKQAAIMAAMEHPRIVLECTPTSVFTAILQAAQLGYNLGSAYNEAYLVPYRDKRRGVTECKLTPGWKGMKLAIERSGVVDYISASIVHENDECEISFQPPGAYHGANLKKDRGEWLGVLACAYRLPTTSDGEKQLIDFEYLSEDRILAAKAQARDKSLWEKWPAEFWKKTGIRALCKKFPLVNDELVTMVSWDNASNIPLKEQAAAAHLEEPDPINLESIRLTQNFQDAEATAIAVKKLPQAEVLPPPPESPQAAEAKKKTKPRKKRTTKKQKEDNGLNAPAPFGFA